jgi:hypothetical protein
MPLEVDEALLERRQVLLVHFPDVDAAVVLERAHGGDDHGGVRPQAGLAALDVEELLGAQVGAEARLGDDVIDELQRALRGDHGVAAVRDVGERPAVDERRVVLERLHQVRRQRVLEEHGHRAMRLQVGRLHRLLVARVADHDVAQALLQIVERVGQAENRHHFRGDDNVEAVLARVAVRRPAQGDGDLAQRPVVHVEHALPRDAPHVDAELVAVVDMVVDQRGEQVVGELDGAEVAGKVQVDVLHRHHLRVAAAGRAALHAEHRPERRLAEADHRLLANVVQRVAEAHRGGRLALARRGRADRRHQDQLPVLAALERVQVLQRQLGLVVPVGLEVLLGNAELLSRHGGNALHLRGLGDFDVRRHDCGSSARRWACPASWTEAAILQDSRSRRP